MGLVKPLKSRIPSNKTCKKKSKITYLYFVQSLKEYITLEECKLLCNSKNDKDSFWVLKTYEADGIIYWKIWKQYKKIKEKMTSMEQNT